MAYAIAGCGLIVGCQWLPRGGGTRPDAGVRVVTFNRDIAPILYENCVTCHRPAAAQGRVAAEQAGLVPRPADSELCIAGAPSSLLDYDSARAHASKIADATRRRAMPPWLPVPGHGRFVNERRLGDTCSAPSPSIRSMARRIATSPSHWLARASRRRDRARPQRHCASIPGRRSSANTWNGCSPPGADVY